ncbi:MAG: hypothetical protein C0504_06505 [Candidatus Solibacter sp.]|nr:hypothetical protein [Candidatus Solibacter sp.]
MSKLLVALFALAAIAAPADPMAGPNSGILIDSQTRAVRLIVGVPGSAYAGESAVREADSALAAPDGRTALITRGSSIHAVRQLDSAQPVWISLGDEGPAPGRAAWSQDAQALAVHLPGQSRLRLWSGIQDAPEISGEVDLSAIDGSLAALAVASGGRTAFAAFDSGDHGILYILKAGESPRMLLTLARAGAIAIQDNVLYAADRGRNEVIRVDNWDSEVSVATVATSSHGVSDPVGIGLANRGQTLLIACGDTRRLIALGLRSSAVEAAIELEFSPTGLERSGPVFLLASGAAGERPAQVLDAASMKVFFVPIPAPAAAASLE